MIGIFITIFTIVLLIGYFIGVVGFCISILVAMISGGISIVCAITGNVVGASTAGPILMLSVTIGLVCLAIILFCALLLWILSLLTGGGATNSLTSGLLAFSPAKTSFAGFINPTAILGKLFGNAPNLGGLSNPIGDVINSGMGIFGLLFMSAEEKAKLPADILKMLDCFRKCLCDCNCDENNDPGSAFVDKLGNTITDLKHKLEDALRTGNTVLVNYYTDLLKKAEDAKRGLEQARGQIEQSGNDAADVIQNMPGTLVQTGEKLHEDFNNGVSNLFGG